MNTALEFSQVDFAYGKTAVLRRLSFALAPGELACLLGASGCGKSTALRLAAGFERPLKGDILIDGQVVANAAVLKPPEQRGLGMVFQDFALFPHLNAADNVGFGLHTLPKAQARARTEAAMARVGISECARRFPHELSGGQQQRVALARALAPEPALLLLDEPFSSLDTRLRTSLAREVRDLLRDRGIAALLVTHDQDEAFAFADHIGVMHQGQIEQWATPYTLYHQPATRFVAGFVGESAFVPGTLDGQGSVETPLGRFITQSLDKHSEVSVLLRPDDFVLDASGREFKIIDQSFRGAETLHRVALDELELLALLPSHVEVAIGSVIRLSAQPTHVVVFPN